MMNFLVFMIFIVGTLGSIFDPTMDIGEETLTSNSTKIKNFLSWVYSNSESMKFKVRMFTDMDRGIVPEEPIKAGDVMMKIKLDHVICKQTIMKVLSPESKKIVSDLNDFELISVFLILQKALGKKSHWYRYIDILPNHFDLPANYDYQQIMALEDPTFKDYTLFLKQERLELYARLKPTISKLLSQENVSFKSMVWGTSLLAFHWGMNMAHSRHIKIQGQPYLIPLMDFRNYVASGNAFDKQDKRPDEYNKIQDDYMVVTAQKAFKVNRPITLDYEGYASHYYMINYGFVPKSNPSDCLLLFLPRFNVTEERHQQIQTILSKWNMQEGTFACYDATRHMNDNILTYLALSDANDDTLNRCIDTDGSMIETPPPKGMQVGGMHEAVDSSGNWSIERKRQCVTSRKEEKHPEDWETKQNKMKERLRDYMQFIYDQFTTTVSEDYFILHQNEKDNSTNIPIKWRVSRKLLFLLAFQALPQTETLPQMIENRRENRRINDTSMDYDQWARLHTTSLKLTLSDTLWEAFGVFALSEISRGEEVMVVRDNGVLSLDYVFKDRLLGDDFRNLYTNYDFSEESILALYMLYVVDVEESSHDLYQLFSLLPPLESMTTPILLKDSDLVALYGSPLYQDILDIRANMEVIYDKYKAVFGTYKQLKRKLPTTVVTFDRFKWAYLTILAQTIIYNGRVILLPYYSFSQPSIHQTVGSLPVIQHEDDAYHLYSNDHVEKQRDFFITFGEPNWYTFLYRGVLVPSVRNDCYKFFLQIDVMDKSYDTKAKHLRDYQLPESQYFCIGESLDDNDPAFLVMWNIIHGLDPDDKKGGYSLLLNEVNKLYHGYITPLVSDRRNTRRGLLHERLNEVTKYLSIEKQLLFNIRKNIAKYLNIKSPLK